jgi:hypothetical protein
LAVRLCNISYLRITDKYVLNFIGVKWFLATLPGRRGVGFLPRNLHPFEPSAQLIWGGFLAVRLCNISYLRITDSYVLNFIGVKWFMATLPGRRGVAENMSFSATRSRVRSPLLRREIFLLLQCCSELRQQPQRCRDRTDALRHYVHPIKKRTAGPRAAVAGRCGRGRHPVDGFKSFETECSPSKLQSVARNEPCFAENSVKVAENCSKMA